MTSSHTSDSEYLIPGDVAVVVSLLVGMIGGLVLGRAIWKPIR